MFTYPPFLLLVPPLHTASTPYSDPGGFVAALHFSAGVPLSETPVGMWSGSVGGLLVCGTQWVKVMFSWPKMVIGMLQLMFSQ